MPPALIVHVRNGGEAEEAILGGAAILSATAEALREVAGVAAGRAAIMLRLDSDFGGDIADLATLADKVAVPFGGTGAVSPQDASRRLDGLKVRQERVAVLFADNEPDDLPSPADLAKAGFTVVLLDLSNSSGRGLPATIGLPKLRRLTDDCRAEGLRVFLGGALEAPDVPRLRVLSPDALFFDTGLRRNEVSGREAVRDIAALIALEPVVSSGPTDRIFLRDRVVEMEIGAYGHERGRRQRVRFCVEADVARALASSGMGGVYSYDLIADAIAILADGAHVDFVEALAEDLSRMVLADPRVASVRVRVEKLDLGSGSFGIEIFRAR